MCGQYNMIVCVMCGQYNMIVCGQYNMIVCVMCGQYNMIAWVISPRARRLLFNPECAYVCKVVSIVEFYAEFRYARLTKIGCWVNSQLHFKEGYPL